MKIAKSVGHGLALAALLFSLNPAQAAITVVSDAAAFNAAITSAGIETFFGVAQDAASGSPMYRRTQLGTTYNYQAEASTSSLLGAGTEDDNWLTANVATDVITFSKFSPGITAFGGNFFGSDFNGQYLQGNVSLSVTDSSGATLTQTLTDASQLSFLGFVSNGPQIVSVSLWSEPLSSGDSLWPTARMLVFGQSAAAVPEPTSAMLLVIGLGGLGLLARRKRS